MNIKNILSEKNHTIKGHPDPIFILSALNPSRPSKWGETQEWLQEKKTGSGWKKVSSHSWGNRWKWKWACVLNYDTEVMISSWGARCWFLSRVSLFWVKHTEHFVWIGKYEYFVPLLKAFCSFLISGKRVTFQNNHDNTIQEIRWDRHQTLL